MAKTLEALKIRKKKLEALLKKVDKEIADGTSGELFKLRLNEDTTEELVKSVRLSNINEVEG